MNDHEPRPHVVQQVRTLQITIAALIVGAMVMAVMAIVVHSQGVQIAIAAMPLLSTIAAIQAVALLTVRPIVLSSMLRNARQKLSAEDLENDETWMRIYSGLTITGAALLEGGAFLFFIAYMLEGEWWALAGGGAMIALMAALHFPAAAKVVAWIDE